MDRLGVFASTACAVHCSVGAVLAGAAGVGHFFDEPTELVFVAIACIIAVFALAHGWSLHRSLRPILAGATGFAIFFAVRVLELEHHDAELIGSIVGSAMLVLGHVLNLGALRRCEHECCVADETRTATET